MRRRVINLLAVLSALPCAAAGALWVRSYFAWDRGFACGAVEGEAQRVVHVSSARGRLSVCVERADGFSLGSPPREGMRLYVEDIRLAPRLNGRWGFGFEKQTAALTYDHTTDIPPTRTTWTASAPHGFLFLAAAALPAARIAARRRAARRRGRPGVCAACGYDLRATPGRCPECGATAAAAATSEPRGCRKRPRAGHGGGR